MSQVTLCFSNGLELRYRLHDSQTTSLWMSMLKKLSPTWLLRDDINHRHGFADAADIHSKVDRLRQAVCALKLPPPRLSATTWQQELNQLHVHFPGFFEKRRSATEFENAHQMNLLIHWLEYELMDHYGLKHQQLFNLDFNHRPQAYRLKQFFPQNELSQFSVQLPFGSLHLHYIYIGRHFLEMFDARDTISPSSHFKAQHEFNATCGLVFSETQNVDEIHLDKMRRYYEARGGLAFWGYEFDSPYLAKGFFQLGQLVDMDRYQDQAQRQMLREQLARAHVVGWHS